MAKQKKPKVYKPTLKKMTGGVRSVAIEEEVPVNFCVLGSKEWLDGNFEPDAIPEGRRIEISCTGDLASIQEELAKEPIHVLDTETASTRNIDSTAFDQQWGMEAWMPSSQIVLVQYGVPGRPYIMEPRLIEEFRPFLESDKWLKILQNAVFDFKMLLAKHGIRLVRIYCTMLAEQLLLAGKSGLKVGLLDMSRRYEPFRIIRKDVREQFLTFRPGIDRFTRDMVLYGGRDIVLPADIYQGQLPELKKYHMVDVARCEFDCIPCTAEAELEGVYLDKSVLELSLTYYKERDIELREQIMDAVGLSLFDIDSEELGLFGQDGYSFDLKSSTERLRIFRDLLGFDDMEDVTRETMSTLGHVAGPLIAEWTGVDKIISTYGQKMIDRISPYDNRYHPRFSQLGMGDQDARTGKSSSIATGRYSSDFQQLPKPVERYSKIRDMGEMQMVELEFETALIAARQTMGGTHA